MPKKSSKERTIELIEMLEGDMMRPIRVTIHCTASPNGKYIPFETIKAWHTDPEPKGRGWTDIGYHRVINVNGEVHEGRDLKTPGAHVQGANVIDQNINIGVALVGTNQFTEHQFAALRSVLDGLILSSQDIPRWAIYCHNQYESAQKQGKICPGMEINRILYWYHLRDETALKPYLL